MHPYYPAGQPPPSALHGCSDCARPARFAPCDWAADGTFISLILAAVNLLNFPNSKLEGDFCVTASQLSPTNWRRRRGVHGREEAGHESSGLWPGWPSVAPTMATAGSTDFGSSDFGSSDFGSLCLFLLPLERKYQFPTQVVQWEEMGPGCAGQIYQAHRAAHLWSELNGALAVLAQALSHLPGFHNSFRRYQHLCRYVLVAGSAISSKQRVWIIVYSQDWLFFLYLCNQG